MRIIVIWISFRHFSQLVALKHPPFTLHTNLASPVNPRLTVKIFEVVEVSDSGGGGDGEVRGHPGLNYGRDGGLRWFLRGRLMLGRRVATQTVEERVVDEAQEKLDEFHEKDDGDAEVEGQGASQITHQVIDVLKGKVG